MSAMPIGQNRRKVVVSGNTYVRDFGCMLLLIIGKDIRNDSENGHIVGINKIMMSPIELFKCPFGSVIPLAQYSCSENFPAFHKVLIHTETIRLQSIDCCDF